MSGVKVDILLTDVVLPGGVSGPQFVAEIENRYTADAMSSIGPDKILLNKPFRRAELAIALQDVVA